MGSAVERNRELRHFDSSDLPRHRGEFTSQHAIMVRSRQMSEIAGLMDGSRNDQPTLKRFSRYNQSMHTRCAPVPDEAQPSSSLNPQPHTYSKGGKLKTGIFSGNWTLRDKRDMRPSVHNITVVPVGRQMPSSSCATSSTSSPVPIPSPAMAIRSSKYSSPPPRNRRHLSGDSFNIDDRASPSRRREALAAYSRRRSATSSQNSGEGSRNTSLPPEPNRTDSSRNGDSSKYRSSTRERLIPIELTSASGAVKSKLDSPGPVKSRKIPVQVRIDDRSYPAGCENRYRPTSFPVSMLKKSGSCDDVTGKTVEGRISREVRGQDGDVSEYDDDELQPIIEDSQPCHLRRIGGVKSVGPTRRQWHRPVVELFPYSHTRSISKDSGFPCTPQEKRHSHFSSSTDEQSPIMSPLIDGFATHLVIDADSAYRTGTSDSSPSSVCSTSDAKSPSLRKSCPDLRQAVVGQPRNLEAHRVHHNQRNRRAREKRQAAEWMKKPVHDWSFDDVLLWLQYCKLDELASVMIGYDINGKDVDKWDDVTLVHLGVTDVNVRREVLQNLNDAKEAYEKRVIDKDEKASRSRQRMPLFKMVRSASYDKVLALETPLTTRDITVAEGRFGCLQVTKVNGANVPLKEQDCFLEINDKPGQLFRSPLMFTKLVSDAAGEPIRLVVLRRRFDDDIEDEDEGGGNTISYMQRPSNCAEQESSASSGVSSSEVSCEMASPLIVSSERNSEVLRL